MKYSVDPIKKVNLRKHIDVVVEVDISIMKIVVSIQEKGIIVR